MHFYIFLSNVTSCSRTKWLSSSKKLLKVLVYFIDEVSAHGSTWNGYKTSLMHLISCQMSWTVLVLTCLYTSVRARPKLSQWQPRLRPGPSRPRWDLDSENTILRCFITKTVSWGFPWLGHCYKISVLYCSVLLLFALILSNGCQEGTYISL